MLAAARSTLMAIVEKHHVEGNGARQEYRPPGLAHRPQELQIRPPPSPPAVVILDPHNIVLAEIAAGLDLDQLEVDLAGILEAMLRSDRDVDRLVLVNDLRLLSHDHPSGAADHNPVLSTMVVQLQRQTP